MLSPACEAVMVQEPAPVRWTVEPVTLQLPLAAKVTVRVEDAVALTAKSGSPKILPANAPKVMVWSASDTVKAAVPLLVTNPLSPAKVAATPLG